MTTRAGWLESPQDNDGAPDKYRLGAEAELSAPICENPDWWPPYDPDDP